MTRLRLASSLSRFAVIRVRWLICLACFTAGWLACAAWVFTIAKAPDVALAMIAWVQS